MRTLASSLAVLLLLLPEPGASEIYRWTDAQGRVHFTQDLSQVPPAKRAEAEAAARRRDGADRLQRIESPARPHRATGSTAAEGRVFRIPVERAGTTMRVVATLNDRVRAPFIIDTGASDVLIPRWVADELGIQITERTRTQIYQTANGLVEQPVVMLDAVSVGGARAEAVPASIGEGMPVGLLGLSFFNRFTTHVDPVQGVVTLRPNDLAASGAIRGGRSESEWRAEFRQLHARRALLETRMSRLSPAHSRKLERLDAEASMIEEQIEELEVEADRARVPQAWRR